MREKHNLQKHPLSIYYSYKNITKFEQIILKHQAPSLHPRYIHTSYVILHICTLQKSSIQMIEKLNH
jgi:hypothetical protein